MTCAPQLCRRAQALCRNRFLHQKLRRHRPFPTHHPQLYLHAGMFYELLY
nr:MAG TPA: hypothetical protein [Caudoviricetes sp.]